MEGYDYCEAEDWEDGLKEAQGAVRSIMGKNIAAASIGKRSEVSFNIP